MVARKTPHRVRGRLCLSPHERVLCGTSGVGARKTLTPTHSQRDPCVTRGWVPGRPLTEFGRRRPSLPLPLERVKSGGPLNRSTPNAGALRRGRSTSSRSLENEGRYAKVSRREREKGRPRFRSRGEVSQRSQERVKSRDAFEVDRNYAESTMWRRIGCRHGEVDQTLAPSSSRRWVRSVRASLAESSSRMMPASNWLMKAPHWGRSTVT